MMIDILTRNAHPHSFENVMAKKLCRALLEQGVECYHVEDLPLYLRLGRRPDWTLSFSDLLDHHVPLCDITAQPHIHWEAQSYEPLLHLKQSPHCQIFSALKSREERFLPLPIEGRKAQKRRFSLIAFMDLMDSNHAFIERLSTPVDLFGHHQGKDWLKRLKNANHVHLHRSLPFTEKLRVMSMSDFIILESSDFLYPYALACGCLPISVDEMHSLYIEPQSCMRRLELLTENHLPSHSWSSTVQELLECLSQ